MHKSFILIPILILLTGPLQAQDRQILFIAGGPSHGFGSHEHLGGSQLLAATINSAELNVTARVVSGWPDDESVFDGIDTIVIYSDGGRGHPVMNHLDSFRSLMLQGIGFATLHYAVEVPPGEAGDLFVESLGGYFETFWSVNPFWTGEFNNLPAHQVTNGVNGFTVYDEWYYHMRFADGMTGVTPILSDLPPDESLSRGDGPHSNNEHVREAVLEREEPQHTAWLYERPGGGRSFGFTGGHSHWNWGIDDFRRLVANAILWTAGVDVPENGLPIQAISALELSTLTDDPVPGNWNPEPVQEMLNIANSSPE